MTSNDYPALFRASDKASASAQKEYFQLLRWQLILLAVASALDSGLVFVVPGLRRGISLSTAIVLAVSIILMWVLQARRSERIWFDCRAVAESAKTATWRYLMHAQPYDSNEDDTQTDSKFLRDLLEIRKERPEVNEHLAGLVSGGSEITAGMRTVRHLSFEERKEVYLRDRLLDQKTWYENKARANRSLKTVWFWIVGAMQLAALIVAIVQSAIDVASISIVSVLMTIAASCLAWVQAKRHEDLVNSYGLAAQELRTLESLAPHLADMRAFLRLVADVEDAISREHTMWSARRSVLVTRSK